MKHFSLFKASKQLVLQIFLYRRKDRVRWVKSWLFNVVAVGIKNSFKMPIYIYNVDVFSVPRFKFLCPIKRGLVEIGKPNAMASTKGSILGNGTIVVHGQCAFSAGSKLEIVGGTLNMGIGVYVGVNVLLRCFHSIDLQDYCAIGYYAQVIDTDGHFVCDMNKKKISRCTSPIVIGQGAWIGANCRVMKNTHIPNNCIVANSSLVNKDYSSEQPMTIFAGSPARPIKQGYVRVHDKVVEQNIFRYFRTNPFTDNVSADDLIKDYTFACKLRKD